MITGRVWSLSHAPHHRKTMAAVRTTNSDVNEMRKIIAKTRNVQFYK